jgi:predicted transcriptional regulator of viral defense system
MRVTTVERTIVDCIERPDLAGGNEELSNALQTVRALDLVKLVELATARENQSLAGVLGCWLESRREDLFVDDEMLKDLKRSAPSSPRAVLGATVQAGEAHPEWNVILPNEFLHPSFEGSSPDMTP